MMKIFAAPSTKTIIHKGRMGNVYQLDTILNQLNLENKLEENGWNINYIYSKNREMEAEELISLVHKNNYSDIFKRKSSDTQYLTNGLMLQPTLYSLALEHALIAKEIVDSALREGLAFSTIGGGHHCQYEKPLGFGLVNTMAISAVYATKLNQRVALLDLDTHYSNGCNELLNKKENVLMASLWNQLIPNWKYSESKNNLLHEKIENSIDYFDKLMFLLDRIKSFKPSLFIYHLGFDVLNTDRMGGVPGMDNLKLLGREKMVKEFLNELNIPFLIYRGGGYINYHDKELISSRKADLTEIQMRAIRTYID